jgi:hypothetical protein
MVNHPLRSNRGLFTATADWLRSHRPVHLLRGNQPLLPCLRSNRPRARERPSWPAWTAPCATPRRLLGPAPTCPGQSLYACGGSIPGFN